VRIASVGCAIAAESDDGGGPGKLDERAVSYLAKAMTQALQRSVSSHMGADI
jgi:hypothetical protein